MRQNDRLNQICRWLAKLAVEGDARYVWEVSRYSETVFYP